MTHVGESSFMIRVLIFRHQLHPNELWFIKTSQRQQGESLQGHTFGPEKSHQTADLLGFSGP